jgi:crotonobetainyl-CoA:carnitine CoA-transferase CaiB-like acyl-CoA transferase
MMPYTSTHWQRFFAEVGRPDLAEDPRFADIAQRTRHIAELLELASGFVKLHSTAHWIAACERLEIPAAPVGRLDDLPQDPHLLATGFFESVNDPAMGQVRFPGVPVRFDGQRAPVALPPRLGEHTRALLEAAGLSAEQIAAMLGSGAAVEFSFAKTAGVSRP